MPRSTLGNVASVASKVLRIVAVVEADVQDHVMVSDRHHDVSGAADQTLEDCLDTLDVQHVGQRKRSSSF
jgi:hypothetical protein